MSQSNKTNKGSASERIGAVVLNGMLRQLNVEGVEWSAEAIGPDGGLVVKIPSFNIVTGEDGRKRIVEGGAGPQATQPH